MFLLVYLILMLTFGFTLIVTETTLGRMTRKSPVGAFGHFGKGKAFKIGGWLNAVIPMLIVPYYSVIGGWVMKYLFEYLRGNAQVLAQEQYFTNFTLNAPSMEIWFLLFAVCVVVVIMAGVEHGVEKVSKIMMPLLVILAIFVAIYSVTRPGAMEGIKYFLLPDISNFSWMTVVAAMGTDVLLAVYCNGYFIYLRFLILERMWTSSSLPNRLKYLTQESHYLQV